ncbi:hypothetical protein [Marinobacter sp. F4218]|uniref:hypothetical protein n=1 Tax=Marinobacter sp. F4218 TaxID=2862868 RepID=UPI001C636051|nr:hypothetical protein [Marinobacter sp. F4218]MBW7470498.1 hypothetical protein [Marinobacter sp. F4218]
MNRIAVPAALFFLIGALLSINFPGASGAWILDDVGNLAGLADLSAGTLESYYTFLAGGVGSLGRPISLLTFAFQHESWPDPYSFKVVNYLIHTVNFLLVFTLLVNLARATKRDGAPKNRWTIVLFLVIAFAWAASPIHQTTIQYVIQRMAMLAAFWMLIGINIWIYLLYVSRLKTAEFRLVLASALVLLCTVLAVLSKENGILLPLLCVIVFLVRPPEQCLSRPVRLLAIHAVLSPLYLLLVVLTVEYQKYFIDAYAMRDFSIAERVLTQFRILPLYAVKTLYPIGQDFYLLWDNFPVSKTLMNPVTTLLGLALVLAGGIVAVVSRKRNPLVAIGILFFLAAHVLESSVLALELYFEHRNYLPSVGLFIALAGLAEKLPQKVLPVIVGAFAVLSLIFSLVTYQEARIWGEPLKQAIRWYQTNPTSPRTHSHMASMLSAHQLYDEAGDFYAKTIDDFPESITMPLSWLELNCVSANAASVPEELLYHRARVADYNKNAVNTLSSIMEKFESGKCSRDTARKLLNVSLVLLENERFGRGKAFVDLNVVIAKIYFYAGDLGKAKQHLSDALKRNKRPDVIFAATQVAIARNEVANAQDLYETLESRCGESLEPQCVSLKPGMERLERKLNEMGDTTQ